MQNLELPHNHGEIPAAAITEQLDNVDDFQIVAEIFKQLGDPTRIRIFWLLCHCEECVINISAMLNMSSPAISHHLRPLRSSGLIVCRREGKEVYYKAADTPESQLLHQMIEQTMEIACPKYRNEQIAVIHEIHEHLITHMDQRLTIEALSRHYHMNPTSLKALFKSIYGNSIAAHIKEHRMEEAARLLRETDLSIAEIAKQVGYDSQSKFSTAFKSSFQSLPKEYRKKSP